MPPLKVHFNLKNATIYFLYALIVLLLQYALIESFNAQGLVDATLLRVSLWGAGPEISISILLQLIPLNITLIALLNLIYLVRYSPVTPKKPKSAIGSLSKTTIKNAFGLILLLGFLTFVTFALLCPFALLGFAAKLYRSDGFFRGLIEWSKQINLTLINALGLIAASFRSSVWGLIGPLSEHIIKLDAAWKYLICQNIIAWLTSTLILAYVQLYLKRSKSTV